MLPHIRLTISRSLPIPLIANEPGLVLSVTGFLVVFVRQWIQQTADEAVRTP